MATARLLFLQRTALSTSSQAFTHFSIFLLLVSMDAEKKRDFRSREYRSKHKFEGTHRKVKQHVTKTFMAAKPNLGDGDAFDSSEPTGPARHSRFVNSIDEFVSALEKKLRIFKNQDRSDEKTACTFISFSSVSWPKSGTDAHHFWSCVATIQRVPDTLSHQRIHRGMQVWQTTLTVERVLQSAQERVLL